jgi:hypothetical protein
VLVNAKLIFLLSLPGALGFALWQLGRHRPRPELLKLVGWAVLGFLPGFVVVPAYNHARTGSITGTGYGMAGAGRVFAENPLVGLWGLLFSPGKSVFLYCPPLVAAALACFDLEPAGAGETVFSAPSMTVFSVRGVTRTDVPGKCSVEPR